MEFFEQEKKIYLWDSFSLTFMLMKVVVFLRRYNKFDQNLKISWKVNSQILQNLRLLWPLVKSGWLSDLESIIHTRIWQQTSKWFLADPNEVMVYLTRLLHTYKPTNPKVAPDEYQFNGIEFSTEFEFRRSTNTFWKCVHPFLHQKIRSVFELSTKARPQHNLFQWI